MKPWDYDPALTAECLTKVAQLLAMGRRDAVDRHDPEIGGDAWTRGVCAYRYGCHRINQAAGSHGFEWLSIIDPGKRFQFKIGRVPMRFWRGDPLEPTSRVACPTPVEQLLLDLEDGVPLGGVLFRINIVTDDEGALLQASFVALRAGEVETLWRIPLEEAPPLVVALGDERPEGRELPPPTVRLPDDEEDEAAASTLA